MNSPAIATILRQPFLPDQQNPNQNLKKRPQISIQTNNSKSTIDTTVQWTSSISRHCRSGCILEAALEFTRMRLYVKMLDEMPVRDAISWTALLNGFVKRGYFEEALECFREMQISGVEPDYVTIISVLNACANVGTLGIGLWIHRYVLKQDFKDNVKVCNTLIDLYSRCGCIEFARQVFQRMHKRTLVSWNSIIVGFAVNGFVGEALEYFNSMQKEGFKPDGVSFTGALTACSHAGLIENGLRYFDIMKKIYRVSPRIEHYGCIVDLYSRAGRLEDALNVVENMPMKPNEVVLG
ncbi:hypothetical protein WN944_027467 [Citrus x changshan-huyou]|uniref:Pentatricopeptide repeat-containing protein n=1 Tax=Citrus x changshan-huyou TaxID=2935761 RepID=A0AAP0Q8J1_9ROSI